MARVAGGRARWRHCYPAHEDLQAWRAWLSAEGSLTAHLEALGRRAGAAFAVRRLSQGWQRALPDDLDAVGLSADWRGCGGRLQIREVLLSCGASPVVFARTVMHPDSGRADFPFWHGLANRSLGHALFSDPLVSRGPFSFARVGARQMLGQRLATLALPGADREVMARRSVFQRRQGRMAVTEVFLPPLLELERRASEKI